MTENEKILYGFGETKGIVAIQQISSRMMRLYTRINGKLNYIDKKFYPFFFASDESLLDTFENRFWKKRLAGDGFYKYIYAFETWSDMYKALRQIGKKLNYSRMNFSNWKEIYIRFEPITQFMLQSGETLFKTLNYDDLNILFVKILAVIENQSAFHSKHFDQIFAISLCDNRGWSEIIYQKPKSIKESNLLTRFNEIIAQKDPDLLVGYNITEEFAYLKTRYELYNLPFEIGRDKSEPFFDTNTIFQIANKQIPDVTIAGRHFIDLLQIISHSDSVKRETEDLSLHNVAKYFAMNENNIVTIDESKIPFYADYHPDILVNKLKADIMLIKELSELYLPQYFYQAQFVPLNFIQTIRSGVSQKIELMIVREYLRNRHSLPNHGPESTIGGGYTDIFYTGLFHNIVHADVDSLYPSIIISNKIIPSSDKLGVFLKLLSILTKERLRLKRLKEQSTDLELQKHYNQMQLSYKVLINSFYGYLGYPRGLFNDYSKANQVTQKGQQILKILIDEFTKRKCMVIEVDTDGLYVSLPELKSEDDERKLVEEINQTLPQGINLSFGGRYARMLSYKKKNYALLTYDNKIIIKGSALISRSFENFALKFLKTCIEYILMDKVELIPKEYEKLRSDIINLKVDIKDLAKVEILNESYGEYKKAVESGTRQRSAAYELAIKYYGDKFYPGMKIIYYITGEDPNVKIFENCDLIETYNAKYPNVNIPYYLRRLEEYVSRFEEFFSKEDFELLFPKENVLPFSAKPKVINRAVKKLSKTV